MILFDYTADALYATVLAHPDADLPRLVLAYKLEEMGRRDAITALSDALLAEAREVLA